jgi:hypothetical protein
VKDVKPAATSELEPAVNAGVNGRLPDGHGPPPVPVVMLIVEDVLKSGVYGVLQGVKSASAV